MWGANDPDCRKPMVWPNMKYDAETFNPDQTKHNPDLVQFDTELFAWYKKLIGIRQKYAAVRLGTFITETVDDENRLYAFRRQLGNEGVTVIINRSDKPVLYGTFPLQGNKVKNLLTNQPVAGPLSVNPTSLVILGNE